MSETTSKCPTCGTPAVLRQGYLPNPVENWKPLAAGPTPLQAAALAALVAWRKADETFRHRWSDKDQEKVHNDLFAAKRDLRAAADRLIATQATLVEVGE